MLSLRSHFHQSSRALGSEVGEVCDSRARGLSGFKVLETERIVGGLQ